MRKLTESTERAQPVIAQRQRLMGKAKKRQTEMGQTPSKGSGRMHVLRCFPGYRDADLQSPGAGAMAYG